MSNLIDRQTAIASAISGRVRTEDGERWIRVSEVRENLMNVPIAYVVEQKRGNWVGIDDDPCETFECDRCGFVLDDWIQGALYNFCPNCGARMDGKEAEDGVH